MDEEYARAVFRNRERWTMLHWYYFPDSHDTWVNAEIPVDPPETPPSYNPNTKWKVKNNAEILDVTFIALNLNC